jgi:hypothetical protein
MRSGDKPREDRPLTEKETVGMGRIGKIGESG